MGLDVNIEPQENNFVLVEFVAKGYVLKYLFPPSKKIRVELRQKTVWDGKGGKEGKGRGAGKKAQLSLFLSALIPRNHKNILYTRKDQNIY